MDAERFAGRTAIITGGASGLGRATALRIVAEGGRVALWDRNKEMLREAQAEIGASHVVALDVSDATAVAEAALSSGAALGRVAPASGFGIGSTSSTCCCPPSP